MPADDFLSEYLKRQKVTTSKAALRKVDSMREARLAKVKADETARKDEIVKEFKKEKKKEATRTREANRRESQAAVAERSKAAKDKRHAERAAKSSSAKDAQAAHGASFESPGQASTCRRRGP